MTDKKSGRTEGEQQRMSKRLSVRESHPHCSSLLGACAFLVVQRLILHISPYHSHHKSGEIAIGSMRNSFYGSQISGRPSIVSASNNQTMFDQLIGQTCFGRVRPYRCLAKTVSFGQNNLFWPIDSVSANVCLSPLILYRPKESLFRPKQNHFGQKKSFWPKDVVSVK